MASGTNGGDVPDRTIAILESIRDGIQTGFAAVNERIDQTNLRLDHAIERLDSTVERLDSTVERLDSTVERLDDTVERLDQVNVRLDLHSNALAKILGEVNGLNSRFDNFLTGAHREDREEHEELRARIERIEQRLDKAG